MISRKRFTTGLGVCAVISSVPGLIFAYGLNGWLSVAVFGAGAICSSLVAAQLAYRGACRRIQAGGPPWVPCVGALMAAYILFGLLISLAFILTDEKIDLGWALMRTLLQLWTLTATMGIILTVWLALPAVIFLAFWLNRSNKVLQTTQQSCQPER